MRPEQEVLRTDRGEYPSVRFGSGDRPLVIFTGLSDAFQPESTSSLFSLLLQRYYYRFFSDEFTVHVIGRRRGLPEDFTTREMAAEYADLLEQEGLAPTNVLGVSLGGQIAQHLAADSPELIEKLVVGTAGCRVGEEGRRTLRRWADWADRGWWFDVYLDTVPVTYTGYRKWLYPPLIRTVGRPFLEEPAEISDVAVSCRAMADHDSTDRVADIESPTLVIDGTEDHFFPESILSETAREIPNGRLELVSGVGRGAFEERKRAFDKTVLSFFE